MNLRNIAIFILPDAAILGEEWCCCCIPGFLSAYILSCIISMLRSLKTMNKHCLCILSNFRILFNLNLLKLSFFSFVLKMYNRHGKSKFQSQEFYFSDSFCVTVEI